MDKILGFGGLGDCFICALKCKEYVRPYVYTHIDINTKRLNMSSELLTYMNIPHRCFKVNDIKHWWYRKHQDYNKCFNVFAKGYIDIPLRPYHWQPCIDEGYNVPYSDTLENKDNSLIVQVNTAGNRTYKKKPVVEYVDSIKKQYNKIIWVGTDADFKSDIGVNLVGRTSLADCLEIISGGAAFVGFNSILLYWALYNKLNCFLFTDHQGHEDLRIHDKWKEHLTYDK